MPTELSNKLDYFVDAQNLTVSQFYVLDRADGARLNITGTGTGQLSLVQSLYGVGDGATTFRLPDLRGEFIRGWDNGRGVDRERLQGSSQADVFQHHQHLSGIGTAHLVSQELNDDFSRDKSTRPRIGAVYGWGNYYTAATTEYRPYTDQTQPRADTQSDMNYDINAGLDNGKFTSGDPATGKPPSRITADWANAVSEEIINAVKGGGLTPSSAADQLAQVLDTLRTIAQAVKSDTDSLKRRTGDLWQAVMPVGTVLHIAAPEAPAGFLVCDGTGISRTTFPELYKLFFLKADGTARFVPKTVTASVASPSVFTSSGHGFSGGERLRFSVSSGGTIPAGLYTSGDYYVDPAGITANTFYLLNAVGGTRVNITAAGTGTLSCMQSYFGGGDGLTTFNLPDLRDEFVRGFNTGTFGRKQLDAIQNIIGSVNLDVTTQGTSGAFSSFNWSDGGTAGAGKLRKWYKF
ncbi:hypothetical protein CHS0354_018419 [Potamilus streckersoni]|uniref:Phage tail collar domain-containing protein n=1 Tax=Potamilus streckersoni TaxID=2493646 RepID=A0AAE0WB01_9BIVA|nr:hypothetical protein CHS0354_018419 [Potamilus streckersoni]